MSQALIIMLFRMKSGKLEKWKAAMNEEYEALLRNNTCNLFHYQRKKNIIGRKWTYGLKKDANGSISK